MKGKGARDAWIQRARRTLAMAGLCLALSACSLLGGDEEPKYVERPVEELYNSALDSMQSGDYAEAARLFDEVERQHPYSNWAAKAQIMAAYASYQINKYDEAISALDRFIQLHPGNKDYFAYAHYLRAISYYEQISDVGRDQSKTRLAFRALEEVVRRFPESR